MAVNCLSSCMLLLDRVVVADGDPLGRRTVVAVVAVIEVQRHDPLAVEGNQVGSMDAAEQVVVGQVAGDVDAVRLLGLVPVHLGSTEQRRLAAVVAVALGGLGLVEVMLNDLLAALSAHYLDIIEGVSA